VPWALESQAIAQAAQTGSRTHGRLSKGRWVNTRTELFDHLQKGLLSSREVKSSRLRTGFVVLGEIREQAGGQIGIAAWRMGS
jgi:hypothetical protein